MAKARWKRFHEGYEPEPPMRHTTCLSFGFRDDLSGVECWREFKSVRELSRIAAVIQREYRPGFPV